MVKLQIRMLKLKENDEDGSGGLKSFDKKS
jgi:hypothetical protein